MGSGGFSGAATDALRHGRDAESSRPPGRSPVGLSKSPYRPDPLGDRDHARGYGRTPLPDGREVRGGPHAGHGEAGRGEAVPRAVVTVARSYRKPDRWEPDDTLRPGAPVFLRRTLRSCARRGCRVCPVMFAIHGPGGIAARCPSDGPNKRGRSSDSPTAAPTSYDMRPDRGHGS